MPVGRRMYLNDALSIHQSLEIDGTKASLSKNTLTELCSPMSELHDDARMSNGEEYDNIFSPEEW